MAKIKVFIKKLKHQVSGNTDKNFRIHGKVLSQGYQSPSTQHSKDIANVRVFGE
jgi:hypothetical protein